MNHRLLVRPVPARPLSLSLSLFSPFPFPSSSRLCVLLLINIQSCPLGRIGIKCDKCAPGFTGPQCDQCLPNHFGIHCKPCQCEHGLCVVYGDGPDHVVRCECEPNWFGTTCDTPLQLGSNLILDPSFSSLRSSDPAVGLWHLYKDGYASLSRSSRPSLVLTPSLSS